MSVDTEQLLREGFTQSQVDEIEGGIREGLDVWIYAKREFFAIQMRQIRLGLRAGLPVEVYAKTEYDWFQMEEIRKGLEEKLNISLYASPGISYDRMRQIRKGLQEGINLSPYMKLEAGILRQLRKAMSAKVNIVQYIKQGYETEQLEQIRLALEKGVDLSPYLQKEFQGASIQEICKGLERGLDVSSYAKIEYSWQQMREIRRGLQNRVDTSQYISAYYDWQQMREIRIGLEEGLDVTSYRSLMYTSKEMKKRRIALQKSVTEKKAKEPSEEEIFDNFRITVSEDEMEAWLEISGKAVKLKREVVLNALEKSGVTHGIQEKVIENLEKGSYFLHPQLIAKGTLPRIGKDGWYEYFFKTELDRKPKLMPDGSVDYRNTEWYEMVQEGQKVACYHPAQEGTAGMTVTGKPVPARKGHEKRALAGRGFQLMPDKKTYISMVTGRIELKENRLEITRLLIIDEMTPISGNVAFDGSIHVKGSVGSGVSIQATEDVLIDGFVESVLIECGGSVVLRQGVNASGNGYIKAGKDVNGKFFEAVKVYAAGDFKANYCLNCELYAEGRVLIAGKKGTLAGGITYAVNGLRAYNIGNRAGIATFLKLGSNEVILKNRKALEKEIDEVNEELRILGDAYLTLQRKYSPEIRNTMDIYLKVESAIFTKEKQMEGLMLAKKAMEDKFENIGSVKAVVEGSLYEGVVAEINGLIWQGSAGIAKNVTLKKAGSRVAVYRNM